MSDQQVTLGGALPTFMHQFGWWDFVYFITNIHRENGIYQRWTTYALKSKSVSEMHFPTIWRSKFTDVANSKKTQFLGKNGCRQKCLNKSLPGRTGCTCEERFPWHAEEPNVAKYLFLEKFYLLIHIVDMLLFRFNTSPGKLFVSCDCYFLFVSFSDSHDI